MMWWVTRRRRGLAAVLVLVSAAACAAPTENCTPPANIIGTWSYSSQQQVAGGSTSVGTLLVAHQNCHDFDGSMDVIQQDASGQRTRLTGRVTGRLLDATSVQFDAQLNAAPRQHLASLKGTTMTGSWIELNADAGAGASGAFSTQRQTTGVSP